MPERRLPAEGGTTTARILATIDSVSRRTERALKNALFAMSQREQNGAYRVGQERAFWSQLLSEQIHAAVGRGSRCDDRISE